MDCSGWLALEMRNLKIVGKFVEVHASWRQLCQDYAITQGQQGKEEGT